MARIMREECKRLDLLDFDLHALRCRGVQELALAGCTDDEIAAFSGHASMDPEICGCGTAGHAREIGSGKTPREHKVNPSLTLVRYRLDGTPHTP
jgi:hypothetical protein